MSIVLSLIRNEFEKTWRSRWIVFVVLGGLFVLIAGGLYTFYVFHEHRWTPPATVSWQSQLQNQIAVDQRNIADLEQIKQQGGSGGRVTIGNGRGDLTLDQAIAQLKQGVADDQYLIDHDIAPVQSFAVQPDRPRISRNGSILTDQKLGSPVPSR